MPGIQDTGRSLSQEAARTAEAYRIASPCPQVALQHELTTARDGKIKRISTKMRASPAKADATLDGEYRNLSGVGNGAINAVAVAAWKQLRFAPDGSVRQTQGAGAQGSSVATGGAKAHAARYRLDGYTIELQHADGRREYHLFYFFPDGHHAIGLGTATLSQRR